MVVKSQVAVVAWDYIWIMYYIPLIYLMFCCSIVLFLLL